MLVAIDFVDIPSYEVARCLNGIFQDSNLNYVGHDIIRGEVERSRDGRLTSVTLVVVCDNKDGRPYKSSKKEEDYFSVREPSRKDKPW